ncbi:acyl-CoA 6-desaturase [Aplysia californica]|uniref:Acyl-CoA 6-desaturase n=1 Tax=Aplysia californica TaxID=6500 RepID=A0ABM0JGI8_APLCA|nr:acyl-CoA 6-desaturase [Aplysia californica]
MGKGTKAVNGTAPHKREVTFDELSKHNKRDDQWLLINGKAYDVTEFAKKHPGGAKILNHYAGEDATDAWVAFHNDKEKVSKYLQSIYVGDVVDEPVSEIKQDFRKLRQTVVDSGWLKPEPWFYILHMGHIFLLEALAVWLVWYFGNGWLTTMAVLLVLATEQAQAGWTQHDYGHHSVFPDLKRSHILHHFVVGFIKGASSHWWNFRHFQHHAKPNMVRKDPDIDIAYLFLLGNKLPVEFGKKKRGIMPYNWQHDYFFFLGPPLLLPIYFHLEVLYFCVKRRDWVDIAMTTAFFARFFTLFGPFYGGWGTFALYMGMRFFESHWFTWVTQMNHLPQEIDRDSKDLDWFSLQLRGTCNVEPSPFNDWFTGHLNYQIEHHLFPTMPRMNYYKVAPLVQSLCKKHGIPYESKPLLTAFADIVRMLKKSGQLWYDAYHE